MTDNTEALSMEQILAAIRRTAAERPHDDFANGGALVFDGAPEAAEAAGWRALVERLDSAVPNGAGATLFGAGDPDDVADHERDEGALARGPAAGEVFDLPAILKEPGCAANVQPLPAPRRLTDALRRADAAGEPHPAAAAYRSAAEEGDEGAASRRFGAGLRSGLAYVDFRSRRPQRAVMAYADPQIGERNDPPAGAGSRALSLASPPLAAPEAALVGHAVALASALERDIERLRQRHRASAMPSGRRATGDDDRDALRAAAHDSAAELLRPMLRQWLDENMPRIVQTALHLEMAEGVAGGRRNP